MFKQLKIYYLFVSLPFILLLTGAAFFANGIKYTIVRNPHPQINYTIFAIILIGGVLIILNARRLLREARVILEFFGAVHARRSFSVLKEMANRYTGETACLLQMVASSGERAISHQEQVAIEHELTNTRSRLLRRNALPQYLTGLLVGMGLLGTFIGLLATLNDITILISSFADLDMQNASPLVVFRAMIERMRAPMQSMGIAFSASMFGLLGSIILGLMMVGMRRLQGDMFSVLSSEVARHIEIALSHGHNKPESLEVLTGDAVGNEGVAKVLLRIEERYAETARSQQRALASVIDDLQKQRTDMLNALSEQTEANRAFHGELQQIGRQLGGIFSELQKSNGDTSSQVSEMAIAMANANRETHKLLALQLEEQKGLAQTFDSFELDERLADAVRTQQRALSAVLGDFAQQREETQRALSEQSSANHKAQQALQQLGGHLGGILTLLEKGSQETAAQLSELTVQTAADAKETHRLLDISASNTRGELQVLGQLVNALASATREGDEAIAAKLAALQDWLATGAKETFAQRNQISTQLNTLSDAALRGNDGLCAQISELIACMAQNAKTAQDDAAEQKTVESA